MVGHVRVGHVHIRIKLGLIREKFVANRGVPGSCRFRLSVITAARVTTPVVTTKNDAK